MPTATRSELKAAAENVYAHMVPTPAHHWPLLTKRTGAEVLVKHENHTPIGAFKVRGGLNFMTRLKHDQPDCIGVITATRGNHGQSVALAASKVGLSATVLVPHGNNPEKNDAMEAYGGELIVHGEDFQEAREYAGELAGDKGLHMIPPFHPWLIEGVGSYSVEFLQAQPDLDTVYVPIGMGSGICGMISARDALGATTEIVGVVAENAPSYALSFAASECVPTNSADAMADGLACRVPDPDALDIIMAGAARIVSVSEAEMLAAMGYYFTDTHNIAEGAGAAPLAALMKERGAMAGKRVGLILSGGNADRELFRQALLSADETAN
ncbi:MAG: threonine dehydratase [Rhodospirillaceae bacterium]|nr:threonine dehydratase [Rhodospirillaceae bacterium]